MHLNGLVLILHVIHAIASDIPTIKQGFQTPLEGSVDEHVRDTLVLHRLLEATDEGLGNLRFFLDEAVRQDERCDYALLAHNLQVGRSILVHAWCTIDTMEVSGLGLTVRI